MFVLIKPMRHKGVAIEKKILHRSQAIKAQLCVARLEKSDMGRACQFAYIYSHVAHEAPALPDLLDVNLSWMSFTGFVLSGVEMINGTAYAQSWMCDVPEEHAE